MLACQIQWVPVAVSCKQAGQAAAAAAAARRRLVFVTVALAAAVRQVAGAAAGGVSCKVAAEVQGLQLISSDSSNHSSGSSSKSSGLRGMSNGTAATAAVPVGLQQTTPLRALLRVLLQRHPAGARVHAASQPRSISTSS